MKKHLFTFIAAIATSISFAQTIPNGSFENWQTTTVENPQFFMCANDEDHNGKYPPPTVTKVTDPYHGLYAVKLISTLYGSDTAQAWIADGNPGQGMSGGIPYSQKPTGLRFYYKNNPAAGDSALTLAIFKKNGSVIGQYVYQIGGTHNSYTLFNATFSPALTQTPDTVIFACASSNLMSHGAIPGSMLQVDSISFTGVASQPNNFNGDLELWQMNSHYQLIGWNGGNLLQTTDKYKGTYALELVTTPPGFGDNQIRVGNITTGKYTNGGPPTGGSAFSNQTDTLVFYYKYLPANYPLYSDSAQVGLTFYKNGAWIDGRGTLLGPSINGYTKVEIPFTLSQIPDTVQISISSSKWPTQNSYVGSDLKIDQLYLKSQKVPVSKFTMPSSGCKGVPIQLMDSSYNMPTAWQWFMTGATPSNSSQQNPVITYNTPGTFTVSLQASDSFGVSSFTSKTITIYNNPVVSVTSASVCAGTTATLTASGASTYTWNTGDVGATFTVSLGSTTNFTVTGTSSVGCSNSAGTSVFIPTPATPALCMVTVDSFSTNNIIYWDKTPYDNVDTFVVYREVATNTYKRIGAVSKDSLSMFIDTSRNVGPANGDPNIGSYRYKLQIRDTCGNYGPMSPYHNTVKITDQHNGTFIWNTYDVEGQVNTPVANFILERDNNNNGIWTTVGTVSGTQTSLFDNQYGTYQSVANWRVQATGFNCTPTMRYGNNSTQATIVKSKSNISNNRTTKVNLVNTGFGIYPNPSSGIFTLSLSTSQATVNVFDIAGNKVASFQLHNSTSQIDLRNLNNGSYFVEVTTSQGTYHQKVNKVD